MSSWFLPFALLLSAAFIPQLANASVSCEESYEEVRPEARLAYLDQGASLVFAEKLEIPSFESEVALGPDVRLYVEPRSEQRFISPKRAYPVLRSREGHLHLPESELIVSSRAYLLTVADLIQASQGRLVVCQKKQRPRELWSSAR